MGRISVGDPTTTTDTPPATSVTNTSTDDYKTYLVDHGVSNAEDFLDEEYPQSRALQFIAIDDGLNLQVPDGDLDTPEGYEFVSRYAFAVLYYATNGPKYWIYQLNFLSPTSACYWYSIFQYIDTSTELRGVFCDQTSGDPVALFLTQQTLKGTLPAELAFVTTLTNIDLDYNRIGGSIPESYQGLTSLINVFAGNNNLVGTFPNINLSTNYMTGSLPTSLGELENIEGLALDNNLFFGNIQDAFDTSNRAGLGKLQQFYIENNQFTGVLGPNFMMNLTNLQFLDVSDNYFNGAVDDYLFELPLLPSRQSIDTLPDQLPDNENLTLLALQKCNFSGQPIPPSITNLSALKHLDLSQNKLTGEITSSIGNMPNLSYLFLAQNNFVRNGIPSWIEDLTNLEELSLKSTQRTGNIPSCLGSLTDLVLLDLDNNNLVGNIPPQLGNLEDLQLLMLNRNNLTSVIPHSFSNLTNLTVLFLDANNDIQGDLDELFCSNPPFESSSGPVIVASCDICDNASMNCCTLCCEGTSECNPGIHVPDLDPIWQLAYNREFFSYNREDFLNKDRDTTAAADASKTADWIP
ncbi:serine threonine-protein kinase BRI1-like [Seminavis robusta]|uniref:Serine threonine-protein kinase BRI1-like n=1 Tax=Seminavis robusta TaxID=568900 RepID=A0A9N8EDU0_9STRA|nr:serine threonine-protein kinase BRI1-like [Seminavis robusta]|eukprot:Sro978_g227140.1 serine threonine-protein kinase BRI1-like (578) ;mRNA; f:22617-24672